MVTDIGLGVVVAVGVLLGLVAGMVVGWIVSRRMGRKDFALQSEAIRAESESEVGNGSEVWEFGSEQSVSACGQQ